MSEILLEFWKSSGLSQLFQCDTVLFGLHLPGELIMLSVQVVTPLGKKINVHSFIAGVNKDFFNDAAGSRDFFRHRAVTF